MTISVASAAECASLSVETLDLDPALHDLYSVEGIAASLRRAASFLCPATPRQLVDAVLDALRPLRPEAELSREAVQDVLELLVSGGDLIELTSSGSANGRRLYLGPPCYVEKAPDRFLVMGVRPFGAALLGSADIVVECVQHSRTITLNPVDAAEQLRELGLHRVNPERWAAEPTLATAAELVSRVRTRLDGAGRAGQIAELTILDPAARVTYYKGRWRSVRPDESGDFIGRRPQEYGAPLWCLVRIEGGTPTQLVDLPIDDPAAHGRDEAWRLQAAIDAHRGTPQIYHAKTSTTGDSITLDFFGPVPSWAQRYLELIGTPVTPSSGLFSYEIDASALDGAGSFLARTLWMREQDLGGSQ